ncbi:Hypothetical predicted protein [Mytilus galloprovincialis]|uniref:CCHC-type domain-containing protein n=2 Tax=Mytilus galloprovincialis TaxID=29158 RepID=A0A8B6DTE8_MYTGA|nr:Hypothetical predicted protein [Mytilus galloprovincialis]
MSDEEDFSHEPDVRDTPSRAVPRSEEHFSPEDALSLFSTKLDAALSRQKKEIVSEIDHKLSTQAFENTNRPATHTQKFKFEGNSKQHSFNSLRLDEIFKTKSLIERGSLEAALKLLGDSEKALKERNKVIRIADKYGWDVVEEYMDDPLTENSEDATKLRQAETRAKAKRRDKARDKQRTSPYSRNNEFSNDKGNNDLFRRPGPSYSEDSFKGRSSNNSQNVYSQSEYYGGKKSDKCFYCNAEGHFAYQCPKKASRLQSGKQF